MNISKITTAALFCGFFAASAFAQDIVDPDDQKCQKHNLDMRIESNTIMVSGGTPGQACAILVGLERGSYGLPGGAEVKMDALGMLALGKFDESGEYSWKTEADASPSKTFHGILVQALSVDEHGCFQASDLWEVDYHGNGDFDGRQTQTAMADRPLYQRNVAAIREAQLA